MATLTITHTPEDGTLIAGTARGDGSGEILKALRWRWSRNLGSWYIGRSRDTAPKMAQIAATATALRAAGLDIEVNIDATYRTTADVEADAIARQQARVDALDAKADRKSAAAESAWAADKAAHDALPEFGEPIKVGHHSERRHRRAVEKSWNALGKAVGAEREATEARGRADAAAQTTAGRYAPATVARRIEKLTADLRRFERARDGYTRTLHTNSQTGEKFIETHQAAAGEHRERVLAEIDHVADQLAYWTGVREQQLASGAATAYGREVIVKGDHIRYVGRWHEVVKVNAKTVTIGSIVGGGWTDRAVYTDIRGLRDADGKTVRIVDGQRITAEAGSDAA